MTEATRRAVFALTSHTELGDTGNETGYYVPEAAHPWKVLTDNGFAVDFISTKGGAPAPTGYDPQDEVQREFLADRNLATELATTRRPGDIDADDYDAILYVGGHGTMWDFPDDEDLAKLARGIYESGGVVAAVCHGPAGLVNLKLSDGSYLVEGKDVAAFTKAEEEAVQLETVVPFLLQTELEERGARHTGADNFNPHVVVSDRLVTGQNPASAVGVAKAIVDVTASVSS
jgi:putative intracellular protease/amidase